MLFRPYLTAFVILQCLILYSPGSTSAEVGDWIPYETRADETGKTGLLAEAIELYEKALQLRDQAHQTDKETGLLLNKLGDIQFKNKQGQESRLVVSGGSVDCLQPPPYMRGSQGGGYVTLRLNPRSPFSRWREGWGLASPSTCAGAVGAPPSSLTLVRGEAGCLSGHRS